MKQQIQKGQVPGKLGSWDSNPGLSPSKPHGVSYDTSSIQSGGCGAETL